MIWSQREKMNRTIDIEALLAPIAGDNPAGENLRYTDVYEGIKEARRADDTLDQGDWQRDIKTSDWDKVFSIANEALASKTKDLQICVWLMEALIRQEGFDGLLAGLMILNGFLRDYWDHLYPEIEDDDLDYRAGPIEFMNDKLWVAIKDIPLTDPKKTAGYSWARWQESRQVGYETDTRNKYGDVDENKKKLRDELIADGKLTPEDFDSAVVLSSRSFYESLGQMLAECVEEFKKLDEVLDDRFGSNAPRLAEFREALEACEQLVVKILKDKRESEPAPEPPAEKEGGYLRKLFKKKHESEAQPKTGPVPISQSEGQSVASTVEAWNPTEAPMSVVSPPLDAPQHADTISLEKVRWDQALLTLGSSGIKEALGQLLEASISAPSVRDRNRYRLLMAKLCLKAQRPDLARPIVEELHTIIEELNLERWESPKWVAEVLDALYQCLTSGEPSDDDMGRATVLFQRLCTTDVTKAIIYKGRQ